MTKHYVLQQALDRLTVLFAPHVKEAIRNEVEESARAPLDLPASESERAEFFKGMAAMYRIGDAVKKVEDGTMSADDAERIFEETHRHLDKGEPASPELAADLAVRIPEIERQINTPLSDETIEEALNEEAANTAHEVVGWWIHRLADHFKANGNALKTEEFDDCLLPQGFNLGPIEDEFSGLGRSEEWFRGITRNVRSANPDLGPIRDDLEVIMRESFHVID